MAQFDLDESAVAQTEQLLIDTGEAVNTQAGIARDAITGLSGGGWSGNANVVATSKQNDDFANAVGRLHAEINRISEGLGLGRQATVTQDQETEASFNAIPVDLGNFGRI